jgi:integrase
LRLGEVLALRNRSVDLDKDDPHGVRFKPPKSKARRRDVTLPKIAIEALREHRRRLMDRLKLVVGKLPDDALLFTNLEGAPLRPSNVSPDVGELADRRAGDHLLGAPTYARLAAYRCRRRHRHDLQAAGPRQAECH